MEYVIKFFIILLTLFIISAFVIVFYGIKKKNINFAINKEQKEMVHNDVLQQMLRAIAADNDYKNYDEVMDAIIEEYPNSYKTKGQIY